MTRKTTRYIMEMVEDGVFDPVIVLNMALQYMSEADVHDMASINELLPYDEDEEDEDEELYI